VIATLGVPNKAISILLVRVARIKKCALEVPETSTRHHDHDQFHKLAITK
jgi:hypothetical protein